MYKKIIYGIFLLTILLLSSNASAQVKCSEKFLNVDFECVKSNTKKLKPFNNVPLTQFEKGEIYFFQTSNEALGKFKVNAVYAGKNECLLYIDPITYQRTDVHKPENYLEIRKKFNAWQAAAINFDTLDFYTDIELTYDKKNNKCVISTTDGSKLFMYIQEDEGLISDNSLLYWAALILIGLSAYVIASNFMDEEEKFKATENLAEAENDEVIKKDLGIIVKYSKPFFKRYFSPIVQNMKGKKKIRDKYRRKLATAGLTKDISPEDFYAMKLFLIIGFPLLFFGLRYFLEETWPLSLVPVLSFVGFYYPEIWINGRIEKRKEEILMGMPFIVDMLALSVEAGLDFVAAMQKVIEKAPPSALVEEFEQMIREIRIGSSRAEGLRQLAWRTDVLAVSSFTATLIAADSVGASIGPILKTLSGELRQKRSSDAEKKGATAATKILLPMMAFVLPSVLLVIMAPVMMQFISGQ